MNLLTPILFLFSLAFFIMKGTTHYKYMYKRKNLAYPGLIDAIFNSSIIKTFLAFLPIPFPIDIKNYEYPKQLVIYSIIFWFSSIGFMVSMFI